MKLEVRIIYFYNKMNPEEKHTCDSLIGETIGQQHNFHWLSTSHTSIT